MDFRTCQGFTHRQQISCKCSPWISAPVEVLGTDSRFLVSVPHGFLHLPGILGTDSRFLVFVLHKPEESWRTNLRKSSAVPNQPDYNEKPWRTNLRYTLAVPNRPNQRKKPWSSYLWNPPAVPNRPNQHKNHGVHICEISPLYLINRIIVIS